jgi:putative transposase
VFFALIYLLLRRLVGLIAGPSNGLGSQRDGPAWCEFLRSQARGVLALLHRRNAVASHLVYVLFAIEVGSRRVHVFGVTRNPDSAWVT